eukprot:176858-Prymnesium_polylepis.1
MLSRPASTRRLKPCPTRSRVSRTSGFSRRPPKRPPRALPIPSNAPDTAAPTSCGGPASSATRGRIRKTSTRRAGPACRTCCLIASSPSAIAKRPSTQRT